MTTPYLEDVLQACQGKLPSDYPKNAVYVAAIRMWLLNDKSWRSKAKRRIKNELIKRNQGVAA
jgi:hypothetical protein